MILHPIHQTLPQTLLLPHHRHHPRVILQTVLVLDLLQIHPRILQPRLGPRLRPGAHQMIIILHPQIPATKTKKGNLPKRQNRTAKRKYRLVVIIKRTIWKNDQI